MLSLRDLLAAVPRLSTSKTRKPSLAELLRAVAPVRRQAPARATVVPQASRRRGRPPRPLPAIPQAVQSCEAEVAAILAEGGVDPEPPYTMRAGRVPYWKLQVDAKTVQGLYAALTWAVRHTDTDRDAHTIVEAGKAGRLNLSRIGGTDRYELVVVEPALRALRAAVLATSRVERGQATWGSWTAAQLRAVARLLSPAGLEEALPKGGANRRRRGARAVVEFGKHRVRGDQPRFRHYAGVWARHDDDPLLLEGFADEESAKDYAENVRRVYGRRLRTMSRETLRRVGYDPREARFWARGESVRVSPGTKLDTLTAARIAIGNVDWWLWGRPSSVLDEAVVSPRDHATAAEYAATWKLGEDAVVVFREYGFPDDYTFWDAVVAESRRIGRPFWYESIDPGVYVLYPDDAKRRR